LNFALHARSFSRLCTPCQEFTFYEHVLLHAGSYNFVNTACTAENQQLTIVCLVFDLTPTELGPTIYCTQSYHANHYTNMKDFVSELG
jgi:hypothetical protein